MNAVISGFSNILSVFNMRVVFLFLSLQLCLSFATLSAQSRKQKWEGHLVVEYEGNKSYLPFSIEIQTDDKGHCSGENTLWVEVKGKKYFSRVLQKCNCTADGEFVFSDSITIESTRPPRMPYFMWCEKQGALYINDTLMTGTVNSNSPSGSCLPAWAQLVLQPDTLIQNKDK